MFPGTCEREQVGGVLGVVEHERRRLVDRHRARVGRAVGLLAAVQGDRLGSECVAHFGTPRDRVLAAIAVCSGRLYAVYTGSGAEPAPRAARATRVRRRAVALSRLCARAASAAASRFRVPARVAATAGATAATLLTVVRRPTAVAGAGALASAVSATLATTVPATRATTLPATVTAALATAAGRVPRLQVGAVGVHAGRELGVEQQVARLVELREVGQVAPADDQVAVGRRLAVALGRASARPAGCRSAAASRCRPAGRA